MVVCAFLSNVVYFNNVVHLVARQYRVFPVDLLLLSSCSLTTATVFCVVAMSIAVSNTPVFLVGYSHYAYISSSSITFPSDSSAADPAAPVAAHSLASLCTLIDSHPTILRAPYRARVATLALSLAQHCPQPLCQQACDWLVKLAEPTNGMVSWGRPATGQLLAYAVTMVPRQMICMWVSESHS